MMCTLSPSHGTSMSVFTGKFKPELLNLWAFFEFLMQLRESRRETAIRLCVQVAEVKA